ncbi:NnrS family protein (plasmid) [Rhizobium sp. CB3171]|uniref:NnrS family protein n=1 Tax=Rhizobium sp. CB3171 TaxID=3039157 RepID=UPI0024B184BC|nr:NnrS family protein [Rhizobium sp. CB3171]WFU04917.1 NnrS family protein [Rhizobium sp. CB3171]
MQQHPHATSGEHIVRGLSRSRPVLFSYGFRPFFLAAAVWAIISIDLWVLFLSRGLPIAEEYGAIYWHAHEMLFGFASAILAGFLLTAIPNWTGRLPISGRPLMALFAIWLAGRAALLLIDWIGAIPAVSADSIFLPVLLVLCAREVIAGRKWKDLKVIAGLAALSVANICFHLQVLKGVTPDIAIRFGLAAYVLLVTIIGGRILPSFTRNWLNRSGRTDFPAPYDSFDAVSIAAGMLALVSWTLAPTTVATGLLAASTAILNAVRLARWRAWTTWRDPMLVVLHIAYLFVPIGFAAIAAGAVGLEQIAILHILAIGVVSLMMLAVMTRASRGHTGRKLKASLTTTVSYTILVTVAVVRPLAELMPPYADVILMLAAAGWTAAFGLFAVEHAPFLCKERKPLR